MLLLFALAAVGCEEKKAPPLSSLKPEPLPSIDRAQGGDAGLDAREALFQVAPAAVFGDKVEQAALVLHLTDDGVQANGQLYAFEDPRLASLVKGVGQGVISVSWTEDVYLAQAAPLFAALDDAGAHFQLVRRDAAAAYSPTLRDEAAFNEWIDEPKPGKLRVIQRADGLELQTNMGKLPGGDPNGPSIPVRGGKLDIATTRVAFQRVKDRFKNPDVCLVPSFGTELDRVAEVMSGAYRGPGDAILELCLVYPRRAARDH